MPQMYTQQVMRSVEIEKQTAFDNNILASLRKEWATFKQCPQRNKLIYTAKQGACEKRADGVGRTKGRQPSSVCY